MWRPVGSFVSRLGVRKAALGFLAINELFWRTLTENLALPVISLLALKEILHADVVGWLFVWIFYFALLFTAFHTHTPFPDAVREVVTSRWFRIITTTNAIGIAIAIESNLWPNRAIAPSMIPVVPDSVLLTFILIISVVLFVSLAYNLDSTLRDPDGFLIEYVNAFVWTQNLPQALQEHRENQGHDLEYWSVIGMSGVIVFFTWNIICGFVGLGTLAIGLLYPLPEILVLTWIVQGVLFDSKGSVYLDRRMSRLAVDLNDRIVVTADSATRSLKGTVSVVMVLFGLIGPVFVFAIALGTLITRIDLGQAAEYGLFIGFLWGNFLLFGLYGVWYWLRELARIPHFLDHRETAADSSNDERLPLVTRPPGYFVAPTVLLLVVIVGMSRASALGSPHIPLWLGLIWVGILGLLAWTVWAAVTDPPQPAATENFALPLSFAVYIIGTSLLVMAGRKISHLYEVISGPTPIRNLLIWIVTDIPVEPLVLCVGFVGVFYLTDVVSWSEKSQ